MIEIEKLRKATAPTDLFGPRTQDAKLLRAAKRLYRTTLPTLHPDTSGLPKDEAQALFLKLEQLYTAWLDPAKAAPKSKKITIRPGVELLDLHRRGTIANLYHTSIHTILKLPRAESSNHFMQAERSALTALQAVPTTMRPYFPELLSTGTYSRRDYNELAALTEGFYSLQEISDLYPQGLDGRDWAWMHRRLLRTIAAAHDQNLVHGAILPENVLIYPELHGVVLTGWSFSGPPGQKLQPVKSQAALYPLDTELSPALDVYMAHSLMRKMLRRNETQLKFALGNMLTVPSMRPDVGNLLTEYDELLSRLYGRRTFRPFAVPASA